MASTTLQTLLHHNSKIANRISSLTDKEWPENLAKQMAEQGLYLKHNFCTAKEGLILCFVCGLIFTNPKRTKKSVDIFYQDHKNKSTCWIPKILEIHQPNLIENWFNIWISPVDVIKSGFSIDGNIWKCHYTCQVSIENWVSGIITLESLMKLHKANCTVNLSV